MPQYSESDVLPICFQLRKSAKSRENLLRITRDLYRVFLHPYLQFTKIQKPPVFIGLPHVNPLKCPEKLTRFPRSLAVSGTNPGHMSFLRGTQWARR